MRVKEDRCATCEWHDKDDEDAAVLMDVQKMKWDGKRRKRMMKPKRIWRLEEAYEVMPCAVPDELRQRAPPHHGCIVTTATRAVTHTVDLIVARNLYQIGTAAPQFESGQWTNSTQICLMPTTKSFL